MVQIWLITSIVNWKNSLTHLSSPIFGCQLFVAMCRKFIHHFYHHNGKNAELRRDQTRIHHSVSLHCGRHSLEHLFGHCLLRLRLIQTFLLENYRQYFIAVVFASLFYSEHFASVKQTETLKGALIEIRTIFPDAHHFEFIKRFAARANGMHKRSGTARND